MASDPAAGANVVGVARALELADQDGALTFGEAMAAVQPLKLVSLPTPIIVRREPGEVKVADLP